MLTAWTLLILLVYNPGESGDPIFTYEKVEFLSKTQCLTGASIAQQKMGKTFSNLATTCLNREPVAGAPLSSWTNLTFLAYNPGLSQRRLLEKVRLEFFTKDQCDEGAKAIKAAVDTIPGMSRVAGACFGRQDDSNIPLADQSLQSRK